MDGIAELRSLVKGEVFDYQILIYCLRSYQKPRDKVTQLLKKGAILRIKKGIYVFGPSYRKGLLSLESVAALIVQPSYISKEYALQSYGIFSERVERITSMTTRKKKHFETPLGIFDYYSLSKAKFGVGVEMRSTSEEGGYLFATKEKAMADWIASLPLISSKETLRFFLYDETRINEKSLLPFDRSLLEEIAEKYRNRNVDLLLTL